MRHDRRVDTVAPRRPVTVASTPSSETRPRDAVDARLTGPYVSSHSHAIVEQKTSPSKNAQAHLERRPQDDHGGV